MCELLQFRSRPEHAEVVRLDAENRFEVVDWVRDLGGTARVDDDGLLVLGEGANEQVPMLGAAIVHRSSDGRFVAMSFAELEASFELLCTAGR